MKEVFFEHGHAIWKAGGRDGTKQRINMKKHQKDKELDAKMWKDKTMTEAFTNHLTEIVVFEQNSHLLKYLH
jgi:hypothetical protein